MGHTVKQIHNVIHFSYSVQKNAAVMLHGRPCPLRPQNWAFIPEEELCLYEALSILLKICLVSDFYKLVSCGFPSGRLAKCSEDWTFLTWGSVIREHFLHQKSTTRGENGYVGASGFADSFWTSAAASFQAQNWTKPLRVINASYCVLLLHGMQLFGVPVSLCMRKYFQLVPVGLSSASTTHYLT